MTDQENRFSTGLSFPRFGVGMPPVTLLRHATRERCSMRSHTERGNDDIEFVWVENK